MRIVFVAPPFLLEKNVWSTVPPKGYGGIQNIMKNLIDGLINKVEKIYLLGAPGSSSDLSNFEVIPIGEIFEIEQWLLQNKRQYDLIHDHSCRGVEFGRKINWSSKIRLHSHYLVSKPVENVNIVAASKAHAICIGFKNAPIIRHPVNPDNYKYQENKEDYFLFLGRVSPWKGTDIAADFSQKAGYKLLIAGPAWEKEYLNFITKKYKNTVVYVGEVGGKEKLEILSKAKSTLVFSQNVIGPNNKIWVEPGSQVVSESAICGTPVISSDNGCLKEIVPNVGIVVKNSCSINERQVENVVLNLPSSREVYNKCNDLWSHDIIAKQYIILYRDILNKKQW